MQVNLVSWGLLGLARYFSQLVQLANNVVPENSLCKLFKEVP